MSESEEEVWEPESAIADRPDETLDCQWLPREEIEPNDWNPNQMDDDEARMLRKSILNNGWTRPIVIHADEHYIIDGEQRWTIAEDDDIQKDPNLTPEDVPAGYVPVFGITVDEAEAKVSTIQHNRARGFVSYDSLADYLEVFHEDGELDEIANELDFTTDDMLRVVDDEGVAEAIYEKNAELNPPWEPRDIREFDSEDIEGTTRTKSLEDSDSDEDVERVTAVFSKKELERIYAVFGEESTADTLITYIRYLDENDLIDSFQDTVGIEPDEEYPHPDDSEE